MEDENCQAVVGKLQEEAAPQLRKADGGAESLQKAIMFYLRAGNELGMSPSELTDVFCVSTPNVTEMAGYADTAGEAVVSLFDELHSQFQCSRSQ